MEALVRERDGERSAMVRLDFELAAEREAKRAMKARAEVSRQKVVEVEEAYQMAEGVVMELRGSLDLLDTARDAAHSELREAQ